MAGPYALRLAAVLTLASLSRGQTCENGAVFSGAGMILSHSISNLDSFTLETWMSIDNHDIPGIVFWLDVGNIRFYSNGRGRITFDLAAWASRNGGTGNLPHTRCNVPNEVDYRIPFHVAGTVTGDRNDPVMQLYFNGIPATCDRWNDNPRGTYNTDSLGAHAESNNDGSVSDLHAFHGWMKDPRVWNVARTPQQIRSTMYSEIDANAASLVAAWNFTNAQFADGGSVPEVTGNYDGSFSFLYGGVRCDALGHRLGYHFNQIEAKIHLLNDTIVDNDADDAQVVRRVSSLEGTVDELSTTAASLPNQLSTFATSSDVSGVVSNIAANSDEISSLRSQLSSQTSTIESLRTIIQDMSSTMTATASRATTSINDDDSPRSCDNCPSPAVEASGQDLILKGRSARFELESCDVNICALRADLSRITEAVAGL